MTFKLSFRALLALLVRAGVITILLGVGLGWTLSQATEFAFTDAVGLVLLTGLITPFALAAASLLIDMSMLNHDAAWEFRTTEEPINLQLRFLRNIILIVYPLLVLCGLTLLAIGPKSAPADWGPVAILMSTALAALGWLYGNYATEVKARHTATINYLNEIKRDGRHRRHIQALQAFISMSTTEEKERLGEHRFSVEEVEKLLSNGDKVTVDDKPYSFRDVTKYILSYLEHVALGIRMGVFDLHIVQRMKRRRFVLYYNNLLFLIVRQSGATAIKPTLLKSSKYAYRRGNDRWENLIWLIDKMEGKGRVNSDAHAKTLIDPRRPRSPRHDLPPEQASAAFASTLDADEA